MPRDTHAGAPRASTRVQSRALGDACRVRILALVTSAESPIGVRELAERIGLHPNAVRYHLTRLREAELIIEEAEPSGGRGRPRLTYRAVPARRSPNRYERLSALLADVVRSKRTARAAGRLAGRDAASIYEVNGVSARRAIEDHARQLGFAPRRQGRDLVLQHCPYANVAVENPETICELHLGMAEGIAARLGGVEVEGMTVRDPYRAGCRLRLIDVPHLRRRDG